MRLTAHRRHLQVDGTPPDVRPVDGAARRRTMSSMATRRRRRRSNLGNGVVPAVILGALLGTSLVVTQVGYLVRAGAWIQLALWVVLTITVIVAAVAVWKPRHAWSAIRWTWRRLRSKSRTAAPPSAVATSRVPIAAGLRFAVLRRDGFRCAYCGRGETDGVKLHIDHLVPVARGGQTELDNLVTACQDCNLGKSANDLIGAS